VSDVRDHAKLGCGRVCLFAESVVSASKKRPDHSEADLYAARSV
jgi:hypothetical protein